MPGKKAIKKKAFSLAKRVLPQETVRSIQVARLEGGLARSHARAGSYKARGTYAVVSAVYNVAPYLDDFFESITSQTMDLQALKVVMVDDGSTDTSADVIRSWQERFPGLVEYVRKENGGQASARNVGLGLVEAAGVEWVTFIDPDDFVSRDYFEQVDRLVVSRPLLQMISCNFIFYREEAGLYGNKHPLRYRFKNGTSFYNVQDDHHPIQLSMATAFFRVESIAQQGLHINEDIRPNFEDGDFVNRFLLGLEEGMICFAAKPKYYYRKREAGTSTIDKSWEGNDSRLLVVTKEGYLGLLAHAKSTKGYVPRFIQDTILYDLSWYFKLFVGKPQLSARYMENGSANKFLATVDEILACIDPWVIEEVRGTWLRYDWKRAILQRYKKSLPLTHIFYVEQVRPAQKLFLLHTSEPELRIFLDGKELVPIEEKRTDVPFFGETFQSLWHQWYSYEGGRDTLSFKVAAGKCAKLSVRGEQFADAIRLDELVSRFTRDWAEYRQAGDTWVIMDRVNQADDNGEHFCRWMLANHPEQRVVFVLRKDSSDWPRLEAEGFPLVAFGSHEHERELRACSKIVSAHADGYVHSYFGDNFHRSKDFVFLQHGVIKDDLSPWLNGKPITLFVTSTGAERNSIVRNGSPYSFTSSQIILTGLPRHDRLLSLARQGAPKEKTVLVMPTWRSSLTGKLAKGKPNGVNEDFAESQYAQAWSGFLSSARLRDLMEKYSFEVVFYPHANSQPYLDDGSFAIPSYIRTHHSNQANDMQRAFVEASAMITDYSSTAFEMAYIGRECLYYQFDEQEFFSGAQVYAKGYFDYRYDGFGPVVTTEDALLDALEELASNNFHPQQPYRERIETTFTYHDGRCCERVYEAIKALDAPGGRSQGQGQLL